MRQIAVVRRNAAVRQNRSFALGLAGGTVEQALEMTLRKRVGGPRAD
jgi:hypothetical protein